jgi:hypothetical protein
MEKIVQNIFQLGKHIKTGKQSIIVVCEKGPISNAIQNRKTFELENKIV